MKEQTNNRLQVLKTYKLYIGGQFPRTESGRTYQPKNKKGQALGNICQASKKDLRDAVVAARSAQKGWAGKTAYNRGQILYRIAELMEGRRSQFIEELVLQGATPAAASRELDAAIDRWIYYAGWCDKYQQLFSTVNPVASPHFNFSVLESLGVVATIAPQQNALLGMVSLIAPAIAGGNTVIMLASASLPLCAISLAETIHASDVPGGVVNILTGMEEELSIQMAAHTDINALLHSIKDRTTLEAIGAKAAAHIQRLRPYDATALLKEEDASPYAILDLQEVKTTWHPIDSSISGGGKY